MRRAIITVASIVGVALLLGADSSCDRQVQSVSGTQMRTAGRVKTGPSGLTVEQQNITERINEDNQPGAIKHLYVISAYSGQVLLYSTVRGKVTSSGKRLTPDRVDGPNNFSFDVGATPFYTNQILGEDGTYGPSVEYLYWWDSKGVYHQHYVSGGQIVHISDQPLAVKNIIINMELSKEQQ
jgi:hypothetical protein